MDTLYDVAIIGYGPAGITAAIYAARKKLSVVLLGEQPGGEVNNSGEIENWPGDGQTDGLSLSQKFTSHLSLHKEEVTLQEIKISQVTKDADGWFSITPDPDFGTAITRSKTVIYATGRHPRLLGIPGENEFKNKGVTYCATCDAPLFPDKEVAVIGGGNSGAEAVIMLQKIAKKIYLLHIDDKLKADEILVNNFKDDPKVEILYNAKSTALAGGMTVQKLGYQDTKSTEEKTLAVQGVFVAIGAIPNTQPVKDLVELDQLGAVKADRYGVTSVPGFFAAGDVTDIRDAQIVVAAGHGCSAALSVGDYLSRLTV
jgi:alkyl hydroperoxide reductase subunit F